ncbi:ParB N-terminal domain-containing protein [Desulfogranum mediterraneum]|uniref:hypothetical protein n=1 Tax=Desulfogranum mediterraneum TaxID=160661 RepID=UPI000417E359|nr:hypothetical protein [Desulfogranum mediterraneum]
MMRPLFLLTPTCPCTVIPSHTIKHLPLKQISPCSSTYPDFIDETVDPATLSAISQHGLLLPLLVQQGEDEPLCALLLSGHRQLAACSQLKLSTVPCLVLSVETPPFQRLSLLCAHRRLGGVPSPLEDALVAREASARLSGEELFQLLELMGYRGNQHALAGLLALLELAPSAQEAIHGRLIPAKAATQLAKLTHQDQGLVVHSIKRYHFGGSKQNRLLELVIEMTRRQECSFAELLAMLPEQASPDTNNIPQQGARLLEQLHNLHAPQRIEAEAAFQRFVQGLQLPAQVEVTPSPAFERDSCTVTMTFPSQEALREQVAQLQAMFASS